MLDPTIEKLHLLAEYNEMVEDIQPRPWAGAHSRSRSNLSDGRPISRGSDSPHSPADIGSFHFWTKWMMHARLIHFGLLIVMILVVGGVSFIQTDDIMHVYFVKGTTVWICLLRSVRS
jgi:hypothetical protein